MRELKRFFLNCKKLNEKMFLMILALCMFIILNIIANSGVYGFREFFDPLILGYMVGLTVLTLLFTGIGKDFCNGFRIAFSKKKEVSRIELQQAFNALSYMKRVVFLEAGLMSLIGLNSVLYHMDDLSCVGPGLAIDILSFAYAAIFALILTFVAGKLEMELVSFMDERIDEAPVEDAQTVYFKLRGLGLTDREAEVARLVSCEMTNKEIGQMLYISDATVKKHITHILEKTGQEDREKLTEMIRTMP